MAFLFDPQHYPSQSGPQSFARGRNLRYEILKKLNLHVGVSRRTKPAGQLLNLLLPFFHLRIGKTPAKHPQRRPQSTRSDPGLVNILGIPRKTCASQMPA